MRTRHDTFGPMLFPVQRSEVIENADEPVRLIANLPDFVRLEFPSLNRVDTSAPPSIAPKSLDVMVGPVRDIDHPSDADSAFPWPTAGATSTTTPATTAAPNTHRVRFIRFLSAPNESLLLRRRSSHQAGDEIAEALTRENRAHALRDRQLDVEPVGEVAEDRRGREALDRFPDLRHRLLRREPL